MGKLTSGILGPVSGKVAGVVGGRWKDKQYLRGYSIPANPNTAKQQTQRGKLADCVAFCKTLTGPIFNEFYDKFLPGMSGFNAFIKANIAIFDGTPAYNTIVLGTGKLFTAVISAAEYDSVSGAVDVDFSTALGNNGLATDKVSACVYDSSTGLWYFSAAPVNRSTGEISIDCVASLTAANLKLYLVVAQYDASDILRLVSDSTYFQPTAA
jgi:hypothetical protein